MAYVRKVRLPGRGGGAGGAQGSGQRWVVLAHLGSARTDAELGILLDAAQQVVLDGQAALDFEVGARAQSMAQVADFRERVALLCRPSPAARHWWCRQGRTLGTSSGLLYDVLAHV